LLNLRAFPADTNSVRLSVDEAASSRLNHFEAIYLKARWLLGISLIGLTAFILATGIDTEYNWVIAAAGAVILLHNFAMKLWDMTDAKVALLIDLTAALIATLIIAEANRNSASALLTMVGASVLIALFTHGWARIGILAYVTGFTFATLVAVEDGNGVAALEGMIGGLFVSGLVIAAVSAIQKRLIEVEAARAQTLGVVSHELRNHLAGVVGAISLVTDEATELTPEEVDEMLKLSLGQAEEASEVIEDLLVASRAERGVLDAIPEITDLCPETETVIRRTVVDGSNIVYDFSDGPIPAYADPLRYKQIIRNLLTNALRYGGDTINVSIQRRGDVVSVAVADDGEGIDPKHASAIFQPYRGGKAMKAASGSTGLGLWIARTLARMMDGDLRYRRKSGHTVFELTLPAATNPTVDAERNRRQMSPVG
jgi:signal transduction histidine kinase